MARGRGADYLCHRRTAIETTAGPREAWLHVAQLACIGLALVFGIVFEITRSVWLVMLGAVLLHSVLAFIDVKYTIPRRHISPFEQQVHGYLEVIPLVAVALVGILHWQQLWNAPPSGPVAAHALMLNHEMLARPAGIGLLASFALLGGVPVIEELVRTLRGRAARHEAQAPVASRRQAS